MTTIWCMQAEAERGVRTSSNWQGLDLDLFGGQDKSRSSHAWPMFGLREMVGDKSKGEL